MTNPSKQPPNDDATTLESLEPRLLLAADLLAGLDLSALLPSLPDPGQVPAEEVFPSTNSPVAASTPGSDDASSDRPSQDTLNTLETEPESSARREVVFVDEAVEGYSHLVTDLLGRTDDARHIDVYVIDRKRDGVAQISEVLAKYHDLDAVHVFSHGSGEGIELGSTLLDTSLADSRADPIIAWGDALSDNADLLIYGCDLTSGDEGTRLAERLSELTRADVAASDDPTGAARLGGDWELEYRTGSIESDIVLGEQARERFQGTLGIESVSDEFDATSFAGNNGSINWLNDWQEIGEADGESAGNVRVNSGSGFSTNHLRIGSQSVGIGAERTVDLSEAHTATLNFDYKRNGGTGQVELRVSDGGAPVTLKTYDLNTVDGAPLSDSFDISDHLSPTTKVSFVVTTVDGTSTFRVDNVQIVAANDNLLLSTEGDVATGGQPGTDTFEEGDAVEIGNPNLNYDGVTSGTLALAFNVDLFAPGADTDGVHFVKNDIQLGSSNFQLKAGDVLLSTDATETFTSGSAPPAGFTNNLTIGEDDVMVFRPDTPGDYTAGTFALLIDGSGGTTRDFVLIEQATTVGDANLQAGDFLVTSTIGDNDILLYEVTDVGAGGIGTTSTLIEGDDVSINTKLTGLHLIDSATTVGGRTLAAGTLLISVDIAESLGANELAVTAFDVIALDVTQTTLVAGAGNGAATATPLFEGEHLDFDDAKLNGVTVDDTNTLWLTTESDVSSAGTPGLDTWQKADIVKVTDPNLSFESGITDGTASVAFDVELFSPGTDVNALHLVSTDIMLGSSSFPLEAGDLLLSIQDANATFSSGSTPPAGFTNNLTVAKEDVLVFRPDIVGDYSSGTFAMLLEDPLGHEIRGVSLIEQTTDVGDATVQAGDFLLIRSGAADDNDVWLFETTDVGSGSTSGTVGKLIEGNDIGVGIGKKLFGIELIERDTNVGGRALSEGTLLLAVDQDDVVGGNALTQTDHDIFALEVTKTTLVSGAGNGVATATPFFEGEDLSFEANSEAIDALTLTTARIASAVNSAPSGTDNTLTLDEDVAHVFSTTDFGFSDPDGDSLLAVKVATLPPVGTLSLNSVAVTVNQFVSAADIAAGLLEYAPPADAHGADLGTFKFQVQDDGGTGGGGVDLDPTLNTLTINVDAVNDAPVLNVTERVFINEFHYDNVGVDTGEAVEIAAPAGTDLAGFNLVFYNGFDSMAYRTTALSGTVPNQADNFGTVTFNLPVNGIQNGDSAADGIALVDPDGGVIQFISYEGTLTALDGPAAGMQSVDIGVTEDGTTPVGHSLQLTGSGPEYSFAAAGPSTFGAINAGQSFASISGAVADTVAEEVVLVFAAAGGNAITVSDVDAGELGAPDPISISLSVGNGTLTLGTIAGLVNLSGDGTGSVKFDGTVAEVNAALEGLGYQPALDFTGTDVLDIDVDDQGNSGSGGVKFDSGAVVITVTPVNDDPFNDGAAPAGAVVLEDVATEVDLSAIDLEDVDANGAAITLILDTGGGGVLFSSGGPGVTVSDSGTDSMTLVGTLADLNNLLDDTTAIEYLNDPGTTVDSILVKVNDGGNTGTGGGTDVLLETVAVTVTPVNDPPSGTDNTVNTDEDTDFGFSVADFGFSDAIEGDGLLAVKITALPAGGTGTLTLNAVAVTAGQLVSAADIGAGLFKYTPPGDGNGAALASFTFQVQDDGGTANGGVDLDPTPNVMTIDVDAVNDAPVLDNTGVMTLTDVLKDNANPPGNSVASIVSSGGGNRITDVDAGALEGLAVIGVDDTNGSWEYSTNGGASFTSFVASGVVNGGIDDTAAVLLDQSALIRFVPNIGYAGPAGDITFRAWDQTNGADGDVGIDVSTNGNDTAFSIETETASLNVISANGVENLVPSAQNTNEDTDLVFSSANGNAITVDDGSAGNPVLRTTLTVTNGILTLASTGGITFESGADGTATMTIKGLESAINAALDGLTYTPTGEFSGSANLQITTDVSADLLARYSFDDGLNPGNDDSPAGANDGTVTGATAVFDPTRPGDALSFDGDDSVRISGSLGDPTDVTLAAWVNLDGGFDFEEAITLGDNIALRLDTTAVGVEGFFFDGTSFHSTGSGVFVGGTGWHHLAFTFDDAANQQIIYIDGTPIVATAHPESISYTLGTDTFLGSHGDGGGNFFSFHGKMDDARIYDRALTGGEITALALDQPSDTDSIDITVDPVNDEPAGTDNTVSTDEDTDLVLSAADFGFSDPVEGDALLAIKITSLPTGGTGTLTLNTVPVTAGQLVSATDIGSGLLKYTPPGDLNGAGLASFTFQVQDDGGTTNGGIDLDATANTLTIDVTAVNDEPAGTDNTVTTLEDTGHVFSTADFGFSDVIDGDSLLGVKVTTLPATGTLTLNAVVVTLGQTVSAVDIAANKLVYTPPSNVNGAGVASFTFQVQDDGGTTNSGVDLDATPNTLTIDVTAVNDEPAGTDNTVTTLEDTGHVFSIADFGFTDVIDGNSLLGVKITTLPAAGTGTLTLNSIAVSVGQTVSAADIATNKLVYTPPSNVNGAGVASFAFQVQDDGGTANSGVDLDATPNTLTVDITAVNDEPAGTDTTVTTLEDTDHVFATTDFGFSDTLDSDALLGVTITTLPAVGTGTLTLNSVAVVAGQTVSAVDIAANRLVFTPQPNLNGNGAASFTFQVQDDGGITNGGIDLDQTANTLTVDITAVNDEPAGTDTTVTTLEDTDHVFATTDFGFSDTLDSDALLGVTITTLPAVGTGTLTLNSVAVTAGQTVSAVDIAANRLVFTPAPNLNGNGAASFAFQVQDDGGTANSGVDLDATANTLTIDITAVNDEPAGTDTTVTTLEDTDHVFATTDFGFSDTLDSDALLGVTITTLPAVGTGTLTLNSVAVTAGQTVSAVDIAANRLVFTPQPNLNGNGAASFTFQVQDDGGTANSGVDLDATPNTLTVDITAVNDEPAGTDTTVTTLEDTDHVFATTDFGFSDTLDSDALLGVTITTLPAVGTGTLTLNSVAVVAGQTVSAVDIAANRLVFTPQPNLNGTGAASFTFQVQDDGGTANSGVDLDATPNTLTVDITAVNDEPAGTDTTVTTLEDTDHVFATTDFGFSDTLDSDALLGVTITTLPAVGTGTLTLNSVAVVAGQTVSAVDIAANRLVFTPQPNLNGNGAASFTFQVQDDGGITNSGVDLDQSANTLTVDITAVNDEPAGTDTTVTTLEDTGHVFSVADFGFSDPVGGDSLLAVKFTSIPASGSLDLDGVAVSAGQSVAATDIAANKLVYTPPPDINGPGVSSFRFQVQDDGGGNDLDTTPNTITVDIVPVNDAPSGANSSVSIGAGDSLVLEVSDFGFSDTIDANRMSGVQFVSVPTMGTLTLNGVPVSNGQLVSTTDIAAGRLVYSPPNGLSGAGLTDVVFKVHDDGGTSSGGSNVSVQPNRIVINVTTVTLPPLEASDFIERDRPTAAASDAPDTEPETLTAAAPLETPTQTPEPIDTPLRQALVEPVAPEPATIRQFAVATDDDGRQPVRTDGLNRLFGTLIDTLRAQQLPAEVLSSILDNLKDLDMLTEQPEFLDALNRLRDETEASTVVPTTVGTTAGTAASVLSIGYITWLMRGGMLLTSFLSSMPAWRLLDPIPVLAYVDDEESTDDADESLVSMVERSQGSAEAKVDS